MTGRVLVTVRCRRKGHVLAELVATGEGKQVIRTDHQAAGGPVADAAGEVFRLGSGRLGGPVSSWRIVCACGRPHLVSAADVDAADAAGESVVIAPPML